MIPNSEMHYSWLGFGYAFLRALGRLFIERWFDLVLALAGTLLGYWLAKRHIEHFISNILEQLDVKYSSVVDKLDAKYSDIVEKLDAKYLDLNRQIAFRKAVTTMLPELPQFYVRPTSTFSSDVAAAVGEFTLWSTVIDLTHTPEKSMEMVGKEAYELAAQLIEKDMGFKEAVAIPNYEWEVGIGGLLAGWVIEEQPDLSIYNWDTGDVVYRHALMREKNRTATSVQYGWMWDMTRVPCGLYIGVVNFKVGGTVKITETAKTVGNRLKIFLKRERGQLIKDHEEVPW